ncbi:hypothetical protein [Desulfosarcina widdelii]|nr:hypothetical protein [Desulfosarcina widdelii]
MLVQMVNDARKIIQLLVEPFSAYGQHFVNEGFFLCVCFQLGLLFW